MRVVHESADGTRETLATDVELADSLPRQVRGLMGWRSVPDGYALVFHFEPGLLERARARLPGPLGAGAGRRSMHMLFVRTPIDVVWIDDREVVKVRTLPAWRGRDGAVADTVIEFAPGAAEGVRPGDAVWIDPDADTEADGATGTAT